MATMQHLTRQDATRSRGDASPAGAVHRHDRYWLAAALALSAVAVLASAAGSPFGHPSASHPTSPSVPHPGVQSLSLTVDGTLRPDLVPDDIAYRHFILATSLGTAPSHSDVARRDYMLRDAGLSSSQQSAYIAVTTSYGDELMSAVHAYQSASLTNHRQFGAYTGGSTQIDALDRARTILAAQLDADTMALIDSYVEYHIKPRIRIFSNRK
jgi:hypothetical protein